MSEHIEWCQSKGPYMSSDCDCPCPCDCGRPEDCPKNYPGHLDNPPDEQDRTPQGAA